MMTRVLLNGKSASPRLPTIYIVTGDDGIIDQTIYVGDAALLRALSFLGNRSYLEIWSANPSSAGDVPLRDVTERMVREAITSGDLEPDSALAGAYGGIGPSRDEFYAGRGDADWHRGAA